MRVKQTLVVVILLAMAAPETVRAVITFSQLADDIFVISHRVKIIGSRGQAMRLAYTKAASLCVAAGYSHFEILQQESQAGSEYEVANASIRVRFSQVGGGDRLECERSAESQYVDEASTKLAKMGYQPPAPSLPPVAGPPADNSGEAPVGSCTIEQIVAMVRAGLDVDQIKAACPSNQ
jgi:hypothetical protein